MIIGPFRGECCGRVRWGVFERVVMMLSGAGTRVLLVGTGTYAPGSGLESVPAVSSTLADLGQVLMERCGVAPERLRVLRDPESPTQLGVALAEEAEQATEVLLFYYVGHGVISPGGQLYVATGATDRRPTRLTHTALAYSAVREALLASKAQSLIVVLDCCFSGRAVETLGAGEEIADLAAVHGGYVLAAASREEMALAPAGQPHTAFTGEFIRLLTDGDPQAPLRITLRHMFDSLERAALARNFPRPRQRASGTIADLVLCTNPAYQPPHQQPTPLPEGNSAGDLCPYPGLAAFGPAQAQWFFGRENLCAELLRQLGRGMDQPGPVVVVGPSGSGKSSLLRAGLLPALAHGVLPVVGSRSWPRLVLTPTGDPLGELATKLAEITGGCPPLPHNVADAPHWFITAARALLRERAGGADAGRARLVVVVDQLEELFTVCAQEPARQTFLATLCAAATGNADGEPPVLVVLGMRADFYGRLAAYPALRPALQDAQLIVGPMSPTELGAAITKPAELVGLTLQPGLPELLLRDLGVTEEAESEVGGHAAGALPLLAHALRATWDQRSDHTLTVAGYQATGGIQGAVATTAEGVHHCLDEAGRDTLRRLMLRLVQVGDGTEDTRRRVPRTGLIQGLADPEGAARVLDALTGARLVIVDAQARRAAVDDDRTPVAEDTVEIIHEALLRAWPRLRAWIDTDRAGNLTHQQLEDAAAEWDRDRRDTAGLYRGNRLDTAHTWADTNGHVRDLSPTARDFLTASSRQQRRVARLRRTALVLVSVLTLAAAGAAIVAVQLRASTQAARATADANQLTAIVSEAGRLRSTDVSLAAQLDVVAYRIHPTADRYADLMTTENTPLSTPLIGRTGSLEAVSFSPINPIMATGSSTGVVQLWDTTDPVQPKELGAPLAGGSDVVFSPTSPIMAVSASTNGRGKTQLWEIGNAAQPKVLGPPLVGDALAFSPDGRTLATTSTIHNVSGGSTGDVQLWDITDPAQPKALGPPLVGDHGYANSIAFRSDGNILAVITPGNNGVDTVQLWNISNRQQPKTIGQSLIDPNGSIVSITFSPNGGTLATISAGGKSSSVRLWNVPLTILTGHTGPVASIAFSSDGSTLVTAGTYETSGGVHVWNIANPTHPTLLNNGFTEASFSSDGLAFSCDGAILAASRTDGKVQLWNMSHPAQPTPVGQPFTDPKSGIIGSMTFSHDGHTLAATISGNNNRVQLWNVFDPVYPKLLGPPLPGLQVTSSPTSSIMATTDSNNNNNMVRLWNIADSTHPKPLGSPLPGNHVTFSFTGKIIATTNGSSGSSDAVRLWDISDLTHPRPLGPSFSADQVAFDPTSTIIATTNGPIGNNGVQLWDVTDPTRPKTLASPFTDGTSLVFSPHGTLATANGDDDTVKLWDVNVDHAIQRICDTARNTLTPEKWQQYIPGLPYRPPCA
ncbi:MAG: caspase, EACC1-associated type [Pseudonocardiaceae bacterium]